LKVGERFGAVGVGMLVGVGVEVSVGLGVALAVPVVEGYFISVDISGASSPLHGSLPMI